MADNEEISQFTNVESTGDTKKVVFGENPSNSSLLGRLLGMQEKISQSKFNEQSREEAEQQLRRLEHENKTRKLNSILITWKNVQEHERKLKNNVAIAVFVFLFIEILLGGVALMFYGFGLITFPAWIAETFFVGVFMEIIAIVTIVVKSLFPTPKTDVLSELNKMIDKM